jgi:NADH:ubiquinone oxidoreductase subunit 4 (subunit M)
VSPVWQTAYLAMSLLAVVGVVLGAWYMLWAVERVFFGGSREPPRVHGHGAHASPGADAGHASHGSHGGHDVPHDRCDLRWHELAAVLPLAVFTLWIGLTPATFLRPAAQAVRESTQASSEAFAARMRLTDPAAHVAQAPTP